MTDDAAATAPTLALSTATSASATTRTFARTTVLPRPRAAPAAVQAARYEPVRMLGEGGMGEVLLVHDHDIGRQVAVKRVKADPGDEAAVLRFAEEVRTVGLLEHPGIVPVHDVGVDEQGSHYLVMKYVEGETLATIIEKMRKGDPATCERFTLDYRIHVFLSLLEALRYAHEKGVIHRDIKPANIMVGPYGEVMLMDWGIAKRIERGVADAKDLAIADTVDPKAGRLVETAVGSLLGTPLYMSPEQAAGKVHELDERSDIYSAALVLLELLSLHHPFEDKKTLQEILIAQATHVFDNVTLRKCHGPGLAALPSEYMWFLPEALAKDPAKRFPSVAVMEKQLRKLMDGRVPVKCPITLGKRAAFEIAHWIDRHPIGYLAIFNVVVYGTLAAVLYGVYRLVRLFG